MLSYLIFLCAVASLSYAKTCPYPNGTATAIHTFNCNPNAPMLVTASRVLNDQDVEMYPIDFKASMTIELTAYNNGEEYKGNKVDVHLSQYTTGWLNSKCEWKEVPTFGLLNNIDGCSYAKNCPLAKGDLDLRLPLDMTSFSSIINALLGDHPYQLSIHMKNYNPGMEEHEEFACVTVQMKIRS